MIKNINRLFLNEIREDKSLFAHKAKSGSDIIEIEYQTNSLGYRDKEFDGNSEILALGCSMTYGQGMQKEKVWTSILSQKLNMSLSSIASRGDSTINQIIKAFYYFEKFGNPKIIVAVFPYFRIPTPYVEGKMEASNMFKKQNFKNNDYMPYVEYNEIDNFRFNEYAKAPYDPRIVLNEEFVFFYEKIFIDMLRQYCKSNGIKLFWSVWEMGYQKIFYDEINKFYPEHHKEYCYIDAFDWMIPNTVKYDKFSEFNALDCHNEYRDEELFYRGADRKTTGDPHWGMHTHLHVAEDMYKKIIVNLN
jgi:hypothetical protein